MALIFGIESSCDETSAAIVCDGREVLSNVVATQHELHREYGGVVPEIASRAHLERLWPVVDGAIRQAGLERETAGQAIDAVAVGNRPGLIGSLLVGVAAAKALAWAWDKPLIGVDHIEAHLHAASLAGDEIAMPAVGLVVSGGHTSLFFMESATSIRLMGRTIDDAVGEAFDKAASILGLGYPGGPIVDQRAASGNEKAHRFPVAAVGDRECLDFSYSGLKTSLLYAVRGKPVGRGKDARFERDFTQFNMAEIDDFCASFQRAAVKAVIRNTRLAIELLREQHGVGVKSLVVGGGVSANSRLRNEMRKLTSDLGLALRLPAMEYCLDNAAMIAGYAWHRLAAGDSDALSLSPWPSGEYVEL